MSSVRDTASTDSGEVSPPDMMTTETERDHYDDVDFGLKKLPNIFNIYITINICIIT